MNWRRLSGLLASLAAIGAVASVGIRVEGQRAVSISLRTLDDPKQVTEILRQTRHELREEANQEDFVRFRSTCNDYITEELVPAQFVELNKRLWATYEKSDYEECAKIAERMEQFLPKSVREHSLVGIDYRSAWRASIGDFRAWSNNYEGALRDYETARRIEPPTSEEWKKFTGVKHAAYQQAEMEALLGHLEAAITHLHEAPKLYFSGCGNCTDGEEHGIVRAEAVYKTANLPPKEAELALLKLVADGYVPQYSAINPDRSREEKLWAAEDADFFLGELYRKQGRSELAREAYRGVAEMRFTSEARMAKSRLAKL